MNNLVSENAISDWYNSIKASRHYLLTENWGLAISSYERSFQIATHLLILANCKNCAIKGYMRTSLEYAYVLRKLQDMNSLGRLSLVVRNTMIEHTNPQTGDALLQPFWDVSNQPETIIDGWMAQLFCMDSEIQKSLH